MQKKKDIEFKLEVNETCLKVFIETNCSDAMISRYKGKIEMLKWVLEVY